MTSLVALIEQLLKWICALADWNDEVMSLAPALGVETLCNRSADSIAMLEIAEYPLYISGRW
jgi:hypothetical protein